MGAILGDRALGFGSGLILGLQLCISNRSFFGNCLLGGGLVVGSIIVEFFSENAADMATLVVGRHFLERRFLKRPLLGRDGVKSTFSVMPV
jgi:hypothetical protein